MAGQNWDISVPGDHLLIADVPKSIRELKSSTKSILLKEHVTPSTNNSGGQHLKGSARVYLQSGKPTTDPAGDALSTDVSTGANNGRLAVDTSVGTNTLRVYLAGSTSVNTSWREVRCAYAGTSVELKARTNIDANDNTIVNLANNEYVSSKGSGPSTTINLIRATSNDLIELGDVDAILMTSTHPTADTHVANKSYVDSKVVTAWASFNSSSTIADHKNISSVTWDSTNKEWDIAFASALSNANFAVVVTLNESSPDDFHVSVRNKTVNGFSIHVKLFGSGTGQQKGCDFCVFGG